MTGRARELFAVAITCGIVIGATITVTGLAAHTSCVQGKELGYSGRVATVAWLIVSPPGGSVNFSAWIQRTFNVNGSQLTDGIGYFGSTNGTNAVITVLNWTMYSASSTHVSGFGPSVQCPAYNLVPSPPNATWGGCPSCFVAPPVPASVGARVVLPSNLTILGYPSSIFNGTYAPEPLGNFSWEYSNGDFTNWQESPSLAAAGLTFTREHQSNASRDYLALSYSIPSNEIGLGIPIHLLTGGSRIVSTPVTSLYPSWTWWFNVTYNFPVTSDQGSWDVFEAAPGSPYSIGGLLFVMTASAPST